MEPHKDIKDGVLDEAVFAANLSEVADGKGGRNVIGLLVKFLC